MTDCYTEAQRLASQLRHNPLERRSQDEEFRLRADAADMLEKQEREIFALYRRLPSGGTGK
jgi:hypothetical protein